jgi:enolase
VSVGGKLESMTWTDALVDFVEKTALLRETIKRRGDEEHYAARMNRIAQKLDALAMAIEESDPAAATAIRSAWNRPVRSLAFRNAAHRSGREDEG